MKCRRPSFSPPWLSRMRCVIPARRAAASGTSSFSGVSARAQTPPAHTVCLRGRRHLRARTSAPAHSAQVDIVACLRHAASHTSRNPTPRSLRSLGVGLLGFRASGTVGWTTPMTRNVLPRIPKKCIFASTNHRV